MHVLVLQHVASEGPGRIALALRARGIAVRVVRIDRGEAVPASLDDARGLVVMGGPMGVYEASRFPHLDDEIALIRAAHGHVPVLGVCLGSQLVAAALGASVTRSGTLELGWLPITVRADDPLLDAAPRTFPALCWHGDVFDLPPGAVALASSAMTPLQAFRHGTTWGLLFHVEADVAAMASAFPEDLARAGVTRAELLAEPAEVAELAAAIFDRWAALVVSSDVVCHIVSRADWSAVRGRYAPPSLAADGFIHLSTPAQVAATVARFFAGVPELLLLHIPAAALGAALRWEPVDGDVFPHLYGPLDPALVTAVVELDARP